MSKPALPRFRAPLVAAVFTAVGLFVVRHFTLEQWLDPAGPLLLMATAVVGGLVVLNAVVLAPDEGQPESVRRAYTRHALLWSLGIGGLGVLLSASWLLPETRLDAVHSAGAQADRVLLVRALDDADGAVATGACQTLFGIGLGGVRHQVIDHLAANPGFARACLEGLEVDGGDMGEVGTYLAHRWYRQFMTRERRAPAEACEQVAEMASMPPGLFETDSAFMSCALTAETAELSACCVEALRPTFANGGELAERLRTSGGSWDRLAAELLDGAFAAAGRSEPSERLVRSLDMRHEGFRNFALDVGCQALETGGNHARMVAGLRVAASTLECPYWLELDRNVSTWISVCDRSAADTSGRRNVFDFCEAVEATSVERAMVTAAARVHGGLSAYRHRRLYEPIVHGHARAQRAHRSGAGFGQRAIDEMNRARLMVQSGGGMGLDAHAMNRIYGNDPQALALAMMNEGLTIPMVNPLALMEQYGEVLGQIDITSLDGFKDLSPEEQEQFQQLLEYYEANKDDPRARAQLEQMKERMESAQEASEARVEGARRQVEREVRGGLGR